MYRINERDFKRIVVALKEKPALATALFGGSGDCLFCGALTEGEETPFIVDTEYLQFRTKCCGFQGGPVNFVMLSGKIAKGSDSVKRAIEWLLNFISREMP